MNSEIAALLRAQPLFSGLEDKEIEGLAGRGTMQALPMGRTIFREGEQGDTAYLIYSGRVRVLKGANGREITLGTLSRGDFVGERAVLTGEPRVASARAAEDAVVIGFDSQAFRDACSDQPELAGYFDRLASDRALINFLRINTFLSALPPRLVAPFMERLGESRFAAGETIFRQGDPGDRLYIVAEGQVKVTQRDNGRERVLAHYDEGDYFGERALVLSDPRYATASAQSDVRCLTITKASVQALLQSLPKVRAELEARIRVYDGATSVEPHRRAARQPAITPPRTLDYAEATAAEQAEPVARRKRRRRGLYPLQRYPWLSQHDETDCGAASLAMIARYYGKRLPVARLRDIANVGREGASMYGVANAAEKVGFVTRAVRTDYGHLANLELPAIAHWAGYHYIVLYEVSDRGVVVGDPAIGILRIPRKEFEAKWTGRLLLLSPTDKLDEQEVQRTTLRRFLPLLKPHRAILAEVFLASLVINLFGLASPLFTQTIIDKVLVHQDVRMLNLMLGGMLIIGVFSTLTVLLRYNLLIHVGQKISVRMSSDLFRQVLRLAMPYFDKRKVGDVLTRFSDNAKVRELITGDAIETVLDMIMVVIYLTLMFFYNATLAGVALLFIPISIAATLLITPMIKRNNQKLFEKIAASESKLIETIKNVTVIKAAAAELPIRWKYEDLIIQNANQQWQNARLGMVLHGVSSAVQLSSSVVVLWYGALLVMDGSLSVGQLIAFIALYGMVMAPILGLVDMWQQLQDVVLSLERLSDIYDAEPEQPAQSDTLVDLPAVRGHIRLENVSFSYSQESENVLSGINLEIQPGQVVALVGRSGSGKSTLISVIQRLYQPTQGRVLIDGSNIAGVTTESLRRQMGLCLQDTPLFTGTIRENITIGDPDMAMDEVIEAARMANAHEFITAFPLGYDTLVGESGIRLSGGQRQRVAIARALLRRPPILIFDEATSSLDAESERAIQENLTEILKDRTALIIAHRLSTIRNADVIAVLDGGMLVESGSHAELMARRGLYHYLVGQQLSE
jgi:ATP-binding cassette subfamily B protein